MEIQGKGEISIINWEYSMPNKINDKDQKGIKLFLQRKVKGIKQNTLSLKGSRIAPNLVLRLNFLAINPSK